MAWTLTAVSAAACARVRPLFAADFPVPIRLWAMLDGKIQGRLLVDNSDPPEWAVLQEPAEGTVYFGGRLEPAILQDAVHILRQFQDVVVCAWPAAMPAASTLPPADYAGMAIDFSGRTPAVDLQGLAAVPPPYQLRRLEPDLIPLLAGFDFYVAMFGSRAAALAGTMGYCVMHEAEVAAEAVAGPFARGVVEIGVGTRAGHRGKGLATAAAALTIQACELLGLQPFWNAAAQNAASVALARRLGFSTEQPFAVLAWSQLRDPSLGVVPGD